MTVLQADPVLKTRLPKGFSYVKELIPSIILDMRYYHANNFVGQRIDGYVAPKCILSTEATKALALVQKDVERFGLSLKVYDAYRPQQAVDHFVRWSHDEKDLKMKADYYPDLEKKQLFEQEYIAKRSGHTRGSAVDLTLVSVSENKELDMGGAYDFFGKRSWPSYDKLTSQQRANRMLLQLVMEKYGFQRYDQEWWHFSLKNEPYPETYFDFKVE